MSEKRKSLSAVPLVPSRPWPSPDPLTDDEREVLSRLDRPAAIQAFLDSVPYSADPIYRCPRRVIADGKAHCFDGALLAAAALWRLGFPPQILDLRAVRDDDHVVTIYRVGGHLGALAKSNTVGLRFREPIFRTLRELCLSYFHDYYNTEGERTLRSYSVPLDLSLLGPDWLTVDEPMTEIADRLDKLKHHPLVSEEMIAGLQPMDERSIRAGLFGADEAGLFRPGAGHP